MAFVGITQPACQRLQQRIGVRNPDRRMRLDQQVRDLLEVEYMRATDHRDPQRRGLQQVVTAMPNEAATDKATSDAAYKSGNSPMVSAR